MNFTTDLDSYHLPGCFGPLGDYSDCNCSVKERFELDLDMITHIKDFMLQICQDLELFRTVYFLLIEKSVIEEEEFQHVIDKTSSAIKILREQIKEFLLYIEFLSNQMSTEQNHWQAYCRRSVNIDLLNRVKMQGFLNIIDQLYSSRNDDNTLYVKSAIELINNL